VVQLLSDVEGQKLTDIEVLAKSGVLTTFQQAHNIEIQDESLPQQPTNEALLLYAHSVMAVNKIYLALIQSRSSSESILIQNNAVQNLIYLNRFSSDVQSLMPPTR